MHYIAPCVTGCEGWGPTSNFNCKETDDGSCTTYDVIFPRKKSSKTIHSFYRWEQDWVKTVSLAQASRGEVAVTDGENFSDVWHREVS